MLPMPIGFFVCFAEMQIKDAYEKIAQCKSELNAAKCIRRNRQGSFHLYQTCAEILFTLVVLFNAFSS